MKYRTLGRTGFQVSEIGLGGEYLEGKPLKQVCNTVDAAMDAGINLLDCLLVQSRHPLGPWHRAQWESATKCTFRDIFALSGKTDSTVVPWT